MPDLEQRARLAGPLLERIKQSLILLIKRALAVPYRFLTLPVRELRGEVQSLRAAAVESIAYVGIELRRLGDLLEREGSTPPLEAPFVFRSLAELQPPAPILIVGSAGRPVGASLASFGYEVTVVDEPLTDWDAGDLSFKAILRVGESDQPDPSMLKRIDGLLARDGILVVSMPFGFSEGPTPGYDPEAISKLLSDWNVAEHTVIASRGRGDWAAVTNGIAPGRGVALVAARRAQPPG